MKLVCFQRNREGKQRKNYHETEAFARLGRWKRTAAVWTVEAPQAKLASMVSRGLAAGAGRKTASLQLGIWKLGWDLGVCESEN